MDYVINDMNPIVDYVHFLSIPLGRCPERTCSSEASCYNQSDACDGIWNCPLYGSDEKNCGKYHTM